MVFEYKNEKILNINDVYRNNLLSFWKYWEENLFSDEEISNLLSNHFNGLDPSIAFMYFRVMFTDAYKILNYKLKSGNININELEMFEFLNDIKGYGIEIYLNYNANSFKFIAEYFKKFALENEFDKRTCFLNLNEEDNNLLQVINPYHSLDLKRYNSDIKAEQYLPISENILNVQLMDCLLNYDALDTYLLNSIIKFMKELYMKRYDNFHNNFKDMIKIVYGYSKYLVDHTKNNDKTKIEAKIIREIENKNFDILEQFAINNYEFLREIISSYLYYIKANTDSYTNQNGEEVKFNYDDVIKYSKRLNRKIKTKLDIK